MGRRTRPGEEDDRDRRGDREAASVGMKEGQADRPGGMPEGRKEKGAREREAGGADRCARKEEENRKERVTKRGHVKRRGREKEGQIQRQCEMEAESKAGRETRGKVKK